VFAPARPGSARSDADINPATWANSSGVPNHFKSGDDSPPCAVSRVKTPQIGVQNLVLAASSSGPPSNRRSANFFLARDYHHCSATYGRREGAGRERQLCAEASARSPPALLRVTV